MNNKLKIHILDIPVNFKSNEIPFSSSISLNIGLNNVSVEFYREKNDTILSVEKSVLSLLSLPYGRVNDVIVFLQQNFTALIMPKIDKIISNNALQITSIMVEIADLVIEEYISIVSDILSEKIAIDKNEKYNFLTTFIRYKQKTSEFGQYIEPNISFTFSVIKDKFCIRLNYRNDTIELTFIENNYNLSKLPYHLCVPFINKLNEKYSIIRLSNLSLWPNFLDFSNIQIPLSAIEPILKEIKDFIEKPLETESMH